MNSRDSLNLFRIVQVNDDGHVVGEDHPRARYTDADVDAVFALRSDGFSLREISKKMEMPLRTVRDYLAGRRRCLGAVDYKKRIEK